MDSEVPQPKQPRSRIEIIADILRLLRLGNTGRIQIIYHARLNQEQVSDYLDSLIEAGLLENAEEEMGLPSFRITQKGLTFLSVTENLQEMLPPEGPVDILHRSKIVDINVGHIMVTKGVADLARDNQDFTAFVQQSLDRYRTGDWGDKNGEQGQLNTQNLEKSMRLFASYESGDFPEIWITTTPDRSYTTIMFPDDDVNLEPVEQYWQEVGSETLP